MGKGGSLSGDGIDQGCDPDSRADRERQVGDGARHRRARERHHRQRRFHAGLFDAGPRHRAADRGRSSNARRTRFTAMSIPRSPIRLARGCATSRASSAKGSFAGRRPIFVGGTGLYFRALVERHFADAGRSGRCARPLAPATRRKRAAGIAPHSAARRSRGSTYVEAGRRAAHRARAGGAGGVGPVDPRMAERGDGAPLIDRASARFMVIEPDRRCAGRAHRKAVRAHGRARARSKRSRRCWRSSSTRRCRP